MSRSSASHRRWDGTRNGGRVLCLRKRDEYYHLDRRRREGSNNSKRTTPRRQTQNKSALLRLGTPRNHQNGGENAWNRCSYSGRRLVAKPEASPASAGIHLKLSLKLHLDVTYFIYPSQFTHKPLDEVKIADCLYIMVTVSEEAFLHVPSIRSHWIMLSRIEVQAPPP